MNSSTTPAPASRKDLPWLILAGYFLAVPWEYRFDLLPVPPSQVFSALLGAVLGISVLLTRRLSLTTFHFLLVIWVAWCGASLWNVYSDPSLREFLAFIKCLIIALAAWHIVHDVRAWLRLMQLYLASLLVATLYALVDYLRLVGATENLWGEQQWRFTGTHYDPNVFSVTLAAALPLAGLAAAATASRAMRVACLALVPAGAYAIVLTASRTGVVCLLVAGTLMLSTRFPGRRQIILFGGFLLAAAEFAGYLTIPGITTERLTSTAEDIQSGELSGRIAIWKAGLEVFADNFMFGVGLGHYPDAMYRYLSRAFVAHNTLLSYAAETGVVGLALFVLTFGVLGFRSQRARGVVGPAPLISLITLAVGSMTLTFSTEQPIWALIILNAGLAFAAQMPAAEPTSAPVSPRLAA
ncbi:MAG TPA: O-antigen ligase family protein [Candidatus Binatia bacterium]|nr:O-antigen ligase family protein [Candidatus Binatia bacterium]